MPVIYIGAGISFLEEGVGQILIAHGFINGAEIVIWPVCGNTVNMKMAALSGFDKV